LNSGIGRLGGFGFAHNPVGMVPKGNGMVAVIAADGRFEHHFSLWGEAGGLSVSGGFQEVRIGRPSSMGVFFLMQPLGIQLRRLGLGPSQLGQKNQGKKQQFFHDGYLYKTTMFSSLKFHT
jgi:hypothetical protein